MVTVWTLACLIVAPGPDPSAEAAVAVAVGLVQAGQVIKVPVSAEIAKPAKTNPQAQLAPKVEWLRVCDQFGCRLVPRLDPGRTIDARPAASSEPCQGTPAVPGTTPAQPSPDCAAPGCFGRRFWGIFRRGR